MSSSRRRLIVRQPVVVDTGCGCGRPNLSSLFSSLPKLTAPKTPDTFSPSSATTTSTASFWGTSPTSSSCKDPSSPPSQVLSSAAYESPVLGRGSKKKKGVVEDSEAVVKESSEPYIDFRDSILHMIVEKEIHAWGDLRDLLHRFLALNSPYHHHVILRAFTEVCNGLFSPPSPPAGASRPGWRAHHQRWPQTSNVLGSTPTTQKSKEPKPRCG